MIGIPLLTYTFFHDLFLFNFFSFACFADVFPYTFLYVYVNFKRKKKKGDIYYTFETQETGETVMDMCTSTVLAHD